MRVAIALLAAFGLTAFAPAPFPRTSRQDRDVEVSLRYLQGKWKVVSMEIITEAGHKQRAPWGVASILVQGDHWVYVHTYGPAKTTYGFALNSRTRPVAIDWHSDPFNREGRPYLFGVIQRRGNLVEILYNRAENQQRVTTFEKPPLGWWFLTLQRAE